MNIPVESVERGDQVVLWLEGAPRAVVVKEITEGVTIRTFLVSYEHEGAPYELSVQRGHTVDLAC